MYHFIINTSSQSKKSFRTVSYIEKELKMREIPYEIHLSAEPNQTHDTMWELSSRKERSTIICVGGDGTLNEAFNGIFRKDSITFGCIPAGSGNDFARGLPFHSNFKKAFYEVLDPNFYKKIDLGVLQLEDQNKKFGVSIGMGFDAAVCKAVNQSRFKKILNKLHLGKLIYLVEALKNLITYKPNPVSLILDGNNVHHFKKCLFLTVMNEKYEGGGFRFCPSADNEDGLLDICVVNGISKWKILFIFPIAYLGKHVKVRGIYMFRCKNVRIESPTPMATHADGEYLGDYEKGKVRIEAQKLKVIAKNIPPKRRVL